jgi:hypothetical protein
MEQKTYTRVFTVRGRPVAFNASRWGGELVALERGYFPVSSTGYRSCTGFVGRTDITDEMLTEFMESVAKEQDREHEALIKRLREGMKPVGGPISNYIHVSLSYEKAFQDGFFATDMQRAGLWAGAHQLLCLVDSDARFQPAPDPTYPVWTKKQCDQSLDFARALRGLLPRYANGDFSVAPPVRLLGAQGYFRLPPKAGGEPKVELVGYTAEMALNLSPKSAPARRTRRPTAREEPVPPVQPETQLGLFGVGPTVSCVPCRPRKGIGLRP